MFAYLFYIQYVPVGFLLAQDIVPDRDKRRENQYKIPLFAKEEFYIYIWIFFIKWYKVV